MSMEVSAKRPTEFARSVKIYLAEREIITKDSKQFSGTLKFVYDRQMDEIYVELWEANGSDPEGKSCSFTGEKKWKILGSDKVWFAYLNTPTSYQDLPAYIQNRIESKIQDSEFEFYRSENGEISMINVVIE